MPAEPDEPKTNSGKTSNPKTSNPKATSINLGPWLVEPLDIADPKTWPPEITSLKVRRTPDGRLVVTGRQFADLLGCTTGNLRQLKRAGRASREVDLDEPRRSWYRLEEVARVYLTQNLGAAVDDEPFEMPNFIRSWPAPETPPAPESEPALPPNPDSDEQKSDEQKSDEQGAVIRGLAAELAETRAELARLKAAIKDPGSRRRLPKHLRRFSPPKD